MGFPKRYGGGGDVGASIAAFETLAFGDLSVLVKVGVQFGLFGGAILHLGTERHHDTYLPALVTGELMGCFAMTETGHGSNVQALGTVARYDAGAQEFVITTEGDQARKDYIGNAARHGELADRVRPVGGGGEVRRVHAFVVPIRVGGEAAPGVHIEDDGRKMGLNGVDNGRIRFDDVRVPRERCSTASPTSPRKASTRARSTTPPPLLHHARHPGAGPRQRRRGRGRRRQGRPRDRHEVRPAAPAVRGRTPGENRCSSTTDCTSGVCCRSSPVRTHCTSPRTSSATGSTTPSPTRRTTRRRDACWRPGPPEPRRSPPGTPPG